MQETAKDRTAIEMQALPERHDNSLLTVTIIRINVTRVTINAGRHDNWLVVGDE